MTIQEDVIERYIYFSTDYKRESFLLDNFLNITEETLQYLLNDEHDSSLAELLQMLINEKSN